MNRSQIARDLIGDLAVHLGLPDLALDAEGACTILVEGGGVIDVAVDAAGRALSLSTLVGRPPDEEEARFWRALLITNALWRETGGLVLFLDAPSGQFGLVYHVALDDLTLSGLVESLERFIRRREGWVDAIAPPVPDGEATPAVGGDEYLIRI